MLSSCCYQHPGVLEDTPNSTCFKPHLPVIIKKHLPLVASLMSQSCLHATVKNLELPLTPSYADIQSQLVPSDFNSSVRASQIISFFSFPLLELRVIEWAGIIQTNRFGRYSKKQNNLHQDIRWHTRELLRT